MGKTGAGKTTLFRLLLGFVRPDSGRMLIYSNSEVCAIGKETRTNFVYVPQGNTLLSGSVRLNLQLAKPDASEQEMMQALHAACADFVLDLPDGLDTEIATVLCLAVTANAQAIFGSHLQCLKDAIGYIYV